MKKINKNNGAAKGNLFRLAFTFLLALGVGVGVYKYVSNSNSDESLPTIPDRNHVEPEEVFYDEDDEMPRPKVPDLQIQIEFGRESKTLEKYDEEILKIEHQISIADDCVTRLTLQAKKDQLELERKKLAEYIKEMHEHLQHKSRDWRPTNSKNI